MRLDYDNMLRYANVTVYNTTASSTYNATTFSGNYVFDGDLSDELFLTSRGFNRFEEIKVVKEKPYYAEELDILYKETKDE